MGKRDIKNNKNFFSNLFKFRKLNKLYGWWIRCRWWSLPQIMAKRLFCHWFPWFVYWTPYSCQHDCAEEQFKGPVKKTWKIIWRNGKEFFIARRTLSRVHLKGVRLLIPQKQGETFRSVGVENIRFLFFRFLSKLKDKIIYVWLHQSKIGEK